MTRRARFVVIAVALLLVPAILSACPVCYGAPNSPMTKSSNNAIIFMLGIIGFVQVGFVAMFWSFWRRARELRRLRESFHLLNGGAAH
jgi:heme/copper-type cytochrome/quinol oxidase subunit 2